MTQVKVGAVVVGALIILASALPGWACGGDKPGVQKINLSIVAQALYGGRADKIIPFKQGDNVTANITADEPMEIFLHGYSVGVHVRPGETSILTFDAGVAGRFPLMIHSLGEGESRQRIEILLGLVDVSPRK